MKLLTNKITVKSLLLPIIFLIFSCGGTYESENKNDLDSAFEEELGFKPPSYIHTIKLKHVGIYDTDIRWMTFNYHPEIMDSILKKDPKIKKITKSSNEFINIVSEINLDEDKPKWFRLSGLFTDEIYYKKDYIMDRSFSEYYLWRDSETNHLYIYHNSFF